MYTKSTMFPSERVVGSERTQVEMAVDSFRVEEEDSRVSGLVLDNADNEVENGEFYVNGNCSEAEECELSASPCESHKNEDVNLAGDNT